jgi:hypothetical protein
VKGEDVKNVHEMLRQKEEEYVRLRKEVDALRIVAPLLDPDGAVGQEDDATETLDEMITRERAVSEQATSPEATIPEASSEEAHPGESASENERKGPLSENQTQTSWWRRLQSGT